jgi:hypothetical protein
VGYLEKGPTMRIALVLAVVSGLVVLGFIWLSGHVDSYDRRYEACMNAEQARLNPQGHYFPDDAYNQAMRMCEKKAGVPEPEKGNPGSWREN